MGGVDENKQDGSFLDGRRVPLFTHLFLGCKRDHLTFDTCLPRRGMRGKRETDVERWWAQAESVICCRTTHDEGPYC